MDYRDIVIDDLADSECRLQARVRDLESDRDSYRELAQAGIEALHRLTRERDLLRVRVAELRALLRHDRAAA